MKFIISIFFFLQSYIYACSLCDTYVAQVFVNTKITYDKKQTFFEVNWEFHENFVNSLQQYDLNENKTFEKDEQLMIQDSLVSYIKKLHYLTNIEYKKINKLTETKFIQNIKPTFEELKFVNNTMIYQYKFSLPLVLKNRYQLYISFNDENNNFNFTIKNIVLNDYSHSYSLEKNSLNSKILFNDPTFIEIPKFVPIEKDEIQVINKIDLVEEKLSPLEFLSLKLTKLKGELKIVLIDIKENNNLSSYIWLLVFSFLYGILHAMGPGHGKSLVTSYFINQKKSYLKALIISIMIGVVHTFSAFLLTFFVYYSLGFIFNSTLVNVEQIATKISATIIIMIAFYLILKKIKKAKQSLNFSISTQPSNILLKKVTHTQTLSCSCNACKTTSTDLGVILAAGIIPCPGTVTIFLFTMNLGIYFIGFISALVMSIGMSFIIFITAIISVEIRKSSSKNLRTIKILDYLSLIFILFLGVFLLIVS